MHDRKYDQTLTALLQRDGYSFFPYDIPNWDNRRIACSCAMMQHSLTQHSIKQHSMTQHSMHQHNLTQQSMHQHNLTQHIVTQHRLTQHIQYILLKQDYKKTQLAQ